MGVLCRVRDELVNPSGVSGSQKITRRNPSWGAAESRSQILGRRNPNETTGHDRGGPGPAAVSWQSSGWFSCFPFPGGLCVDISDARGLLIAKLKRTST